MTRKAANTSAMMLLLLASLAAVAVSQEDLSSQTTLRALPPRDASYAVQIGGSTVTFGTYMNDREVESAYYRLFDLARESETSTAVLGGHLHNVVHWLNTPQDTGNGMWRASAPGKLRVILQRPPFAGGECFTHPEKTDLCNQRRCRRKVSAWQCEYEIHRCAHGNAFTWWHHCSRCANVCSAGKYSREELSYRDFTGDTGAQFCARHARTDGRRNPVEYC